MKVFDEVDVGEWQEIADKCEYATFFHTPAWSRIFAETYSEMEIATKKFVFDDGERIILPLIRTKAIKGSFNLYVSNVAGVYGGWVTDANLSNQQIKEIIKWINNHLKNLTWRINPFDKKLHDFNGLGGKEDFTQYLNSSQGFDSIYKSWTKGHASAARKARRETVIIKQTNSIGKWKEYFDVYRDSIRRWDKSVTCKYPYRLFENFYKEHSDNIKLWLAYFEGNVIAGALCFYHNHHVVYWHGASLEKYFYKRASNLLQYEIIKDACEKGYWWYDFNPSGGHQGVVNFKKSYGAKKLASNVVSNRSSFYRLANRVGSYVKKLF